jgi:hypothetical protein
MAQQTAVEWLLEQIENKNGKEFTSYYTEFIEQAKAMEKEQIVDAYRNGANDEFEHWMNNEDRITSVGYYKRAYNK